jgi:hypothetical protein
MSYSVYSTTLKQASRAAGFEKDITTLSTRHTVGAAVFAESESKLKSRRPDNVSVGLEKAKHALTHTSVASTRHYIGSAL